MNTKTLFSCLLLACLFVGCDEANGSTEGLRQLDERLAVLRTDEAQMKQALAAAPEGKVPCAAGTTAAHPFTLWQRGQPGVSTRLSNFESGTARLREEAEGLSERGFATWFARLEEVSRYELLVIADEMRQPVLDTQGFVGGSVRGRALLWDHEEDRWLCAADVLAETTEDLVLDYVAERPYGDLALSTAERLQHELDADLQINTASAARRALSSESE